MANYRTPSDPYSSYDDWAPSQGWTTAQQNAWLQDPRATATYAPGSIEAQMQVQDLANWGSSKGSQLAMGPQLLSYLKQQQADSAQFQARQAAQQAARPPRHGGVVNLALNRGGAPRHDGSSVAARIQQNQGPINQQIAAALPQNQANFQQATALGQTQPQVPSQPVFAQPTQSSVNPYGAMDTSGRGNPSRQFNSMSAGLMSGFGRKY